MQPLGWLLASLVGFGLVQILLYRHFGRRESTPGGGRQSGPPSASASDPAPAVVECPHCGSPNEAARTVRYCRVCVEPLE